MTQKEQDKLWHDLSEENRTHYREQYAEQQTMSESGVPKLLEELFGKHNLQPSLTFGDVTRELFGTGIDEKTQFATVPCMGRKWVNKIHAIGSLLVVAKFLNKYKDGSDWVPDWKDTFEEKYYPVIDDDGLQSGTTEQMNHSIVYFRKDELFDKAVQILGEEVIRTALTTDY